MPTHIPKIIEVDGKVRTVYVRTPETEKSMDQIRLGPLADLRSLDLPELTSVLRRPSLVVQTPYLTARRVVRTRLGVDRAPHRVLSGTTLLGEYFHANESCRGGFPQFKQLFLLFGYIEAGNRLLHQVLCETVFTRYESGLDVWLLIPKNLEEMSAQWGESFANFRIFPFVSLHSTESYNSPDPVSVATPTQVTPSPVTPGWKRDSSYPEIEDELGPTNVVQGDMKFSSVSKNKKRWNP